MQPPLGAHTVPGRQQPRPGPHQAPLLGHICAKACAENSRTNATDSVANVERRSIALFPPVVAARKRGRLNLRLAPGALAETRGVGATQANDDKAPTAKSDTAEESNQSSSAASNSD